MMDDVRGPSRPAAEMGLAGHLQRIRARFEAAWDAVPPGGTPPRVADFVAVVPDEFRGPISSVLEGIDLSRRLPGPSGVESKGLSAPDSPDLGAASTAVLTPFPEEATAIDGTSVDGPLAVTEIDPGRSVVGPATVAMPDRIVGADGSSGDSRETLTVGTEAELAPTIAGPSTPDARGLTVADESLADPAATVDATPTPSGAGRAASRAGRVGHVPVSGPDGYEILEELGRGGMGVVYKARQVGLDRPVALKMILAGGHAGADQLARFRAEARAIARLKDPGIVQVYEVGEHDGLPYFSLEFIDGGSLGDRIRGGPWSPLEAARLVAQLARSVHTAHRSGIVHRDLKPGNVLMSADGQPKITDFGLAKQQEVDGLQTRSGAVMGTPAYMAPEQASGQADRVGPHSDQYALGVILYELLTGRPPFQGTSVIETLEQVRLQEPVPPAQLQPKLPRDLDTICLKALQKEPSRRYEDAGALADDLGRFLRGEPILARPVSAAERLWRWCRRNPKVASLSAAVALLLATVAVGTSAAALLLLRARDREAEARVAAQASEADAVAARLLAERREHEARQLVGVAFEQNQKALVSQRYISVLAARRLRDLPGSQAVRDELLKVAAQGLRENMVVLERLSQVESDKASDLVALRTMAHINREAGQVAEEIGNIDEARRYDDRMMELVQSMVRRFPDELEPRKALATAQCVMGDLELNRLGDAKSALRRYDEALKLRRGWLAEAPDEVTPKLAVANTLGALARTYVRLGDLGRARSTYEEEVRLRDSAGGENAPELENRRELAGLYEMLGNLSLSLGDVPAGRDYYRRSLRLRERLAAENPDQTQVRRDLLLSYEKLGHLSLLQWNDPAEARRMYEKSLDEFLKRLEADPKSAVAQGDAGTAHYYVATAALRQGDRATAATHFHSCLEIRERLAAAQKTKIASIDLMLALARCGRHEDAARIADEINRQPQGADIDFQLACGYALSAGAAERATPDRAHALVRRYADAAVAALRHAVGLGWKDVGSLETDPDLDPIRRDAGFLALLDELRRATPPPKPGEPAKGSTD